MVHLQCHLWDGKCHQNRLLPNLTRISLPGRGSQAQDHRLLLWCSLRSHLAADPELGGLHHLLWTWVAIADRGMLRWDLSAPRLQLHLPEASRGAETLHQPALPWDHLSNLGCRINLWNLPGHM